MRYTIEFELPDNETVRENIKHDGVSWAIWGYSGSAKAKPAEPDTYEWCRDCKEYDHNRHCCPRWNRVIRTTLEEAQLERKKGKWLDGPEGEPVALFEDAEGNCLPAESCWCSECGEWLVGSDEYRVNGNFCPNCGADMREKRAMAHE